MNKKKYVGLEYDLPSNKQRVKCYFIDLLCMILGILFFFSISFSVSYHLPSYQENLSALNNVRLHSKLYEEKEDKIELVSIIYSTDNNYGEAEYKRHMKEALDYFFSNESGFFSIDENNISSGTTFYNKQKLESGLFFEDDNGNVNEINSFMDYSFISFYKECINKSVGFLSNNEEYRKASYNLMLFLVTSILISYFLSYFIFLFFIPLIYKRGHKTLGMAISKIGRVSENGLNMSNKRFLFRSLIEIFTSFISPFIILIPTIISIAMILNSTFKQSLTDYLSNTYLVDITNKDIYYTPKEYTSSITIK